MVKTQKQLKYPLVDEQLNHCTCMPLLLNNNKEHTFDTCNHLDGYYWVLSKKKKKPIS